MRRRSHTHTHTHTHTQTLEISASYTPELSGFKECSVVQVDAATSSVEVLPQHRSAMAAAPKSAIATRGKFELDLCDDVAENADDDMSRTLALGFSDLIDARYRPLPLPL